MRIYYRFIDDWENPSEAAYAIVRSLVPGEPEMAKTPEGKPYFPALPDFHFSVSHSKGLVIAAVSDKPVGADCEKIGEIRTHALRRTFTDEEQLYATSPELFYEVWTRKEAHFKRLGTGITEDFARFNSLADPDIHTFTLDGYVISVSGEGFDGCPIKFS